MSRVAAWDKRAFVWRTSTNGCTREGIVDLTAVNEQVPADAESKCTSHETAAREPGGN